MTFALYRAQYQNNFYYEYSIDGLAGRHDHRLLSGLVTSIYNTTTLVEDNINLIDFYNITSYNDRILYLSPIFTSYYRDAAELRANLRTDLEQLLPEEFV